MQSLVDSEPRRGFFVCGKHLLPPNEGGQFDPQPVLLFFQWACVELEAKPSINFVQTTATPSCATHLQAKTCTIKRGQAYEISLVLGLKEPTIHLSASGGSSYYNMVIAALAPLLALFDTDCIYGNEHCAGGELYEDETRLSLPQYGLENIVFSPKEDGFYVG